MSLSNVYFLKNTNSKINSKSSQVSNVFTSVLNESFALISK